MTVCARPSIRLAACKMLARSPLTIVAVVERKRRKKRSASARSQDEQSDRAHRPGERLSSWLVMSGRNRKRRGSPTPYILPSPASSQPAVQLSHAPIPCPPSPTGRGLDWGAKIHETPAESHLLATGSHGPIRSHTCSAPVQPSRARMDKLIRRGRGPSWSGRSWPRGRSVARHVVAAACHASGAWLVAQLAGPGLLSACCIVRDVVQA